MPDLLSRYTFPAEMPPSFYSLAAAAAGLLLGFVALRHLKRTFFYPPPPPMPQPVEEDVDAALRRFEAALAQHAPAVLEGLQPGLTDEQIAQIESDHRLRLTDELRALYRWRNGSPREANVTLIPGHWFVPLDEAAEERAGHRQELAQATPLQRMAYAFFAGHRTGWLTVLDDRAGDGYFYDPGRRRRPGHFFYHFAEDSHYRYFPTLANFLIGAAECYETGIYRHARNGRPDEDFDKSYALWPQYASSYPAGGHEPAA